MSNSVRGKFTSSSDLASQVITHLLQYFDRLGENIKTAFNQHGIQEFLLKSGYSFSMADESIDISPFLLVDEKGSCTITDDFISAVTSSAIIAKNLVDGNYKIIEKFVSFRPDVYRLVPLLMREIGVDEQRIRDSIKYCTFPATLRLLIAIAGELRAVGCADAICRVLLSYGGFHKRIQSYDLQITPFNDIIKIALSKMPKDEMLPILEKYIEMAREGKQWRDKKALEWVQKKLN